jgi:PTS system mannose-specific IIB component/fructoselysine and glucoselysine-specific PTS system IIB component
MSIALARIDDRLIHGQVVIGWGVPLGVRLIALVDDDVAVNPWEQEIYRMAVPPGIEVEFVTRVGAIERLRLWAGDARPVFILTGTVEAMAMLVRGGHGLVHHVNVGGVHAGPGRRERLRYVYLTDAEAAALRALEAEGTAVSAQDVPTSTAIRMRDLL